jgi:hypothetical protein
MVRIPHDVKVSETQLTMALLFLNKHILGYFRDTPYYRLDIDAIKELYAVMRQYEDKPK